jgi:hypothetical protein
MAFAGVATIEWLNTIESGFRSMMISVGPPRIDAT